MRVRGLLPAVDSLERVMRDFAVQQPDVFAALGTAGMLCARFVRGSTTAMGNHSWGTAIDLTLDGQLDARGDGRVQEGLTRVAPIFDRHDWYPGAGFGIEDGMHFECSDGLIRERAASGVLGEEPAAFPETHLLSLGDRGPEVESLRSALNRAGASLLMDGRFGRDTQAAVMRFQAQHGLTVDGVAGRETLARLGAVTVQAAQTNHASAEAGAIG